MEFLRVLARYRTPFFDSLFSALTHFGGESIVIVVLCVLYWCVNKRTAYKVGIVYFISGLLVQGLKITFRVDRPWVIDPEFTPVHSAVSGATGYSFPSGHTQSATALYGTLGLSVKNKWLKILCFTAVLTVAFSRMYLGVHTPADVITSLILTSLISVGIFFAEKNSSIKSFVKSPVLVTALIMFAAAVIIFYSVYMYNTYPIEKRYISDCCKAAGAGIGFAVGYFVERTFVNFSEKSKKSYFQIIKFIVGIIVALALKTGIKELFGNSLPVSGVRYFLIVFWVIALWPMIFSNLEEKFITSLKE